ncbi:hypothetical protein BH18ACI5_BH18ACI5_15470 [soil metagenome]
MSKASRVTTRLAPVQGASVSGVMVVRAETATIQTETRIELVNSAERLSAFVESVGLREGILSVWSLHTTCAVFINEAQLALGQWQRVLAAELDGPRARTLRLQAMGLA